MSRHRGGRTTWRRRDEAGSISLLILGLTLIAMLLVAGTVAVTSAHLSRMRLLDLADGAALSAANALDESAYEQGVGESVPLSDASVQQARCDVPDQSPPTGAGHPVAARPRHGHARRTHRRRRHRRGGRAADDRPRPA